MLNQEFKINDLKKEEEFGCLKCVKRSWNFF